MVKILVKKRIATGKIAEKLEKIAACSQGVCIPIAVLMVILLLILRKILKHIGIL